MNWLVGILGGRTGLIYMAVMAMALGFGVGYQTRVKLDEANNAVTLRAEAVAQKKAQDEADAKAIAWENQLAGLRAANKKLTGRLYAETKKAVYSACIVPDDGVRIYNDALAQSSRRPDGSVR